MRLFRITQQRGRDPAFDGVGSSLYPGRWNERTTRVVYATSRISLGILEIMVQSSGAPLLGYVVYPFDVPDELLETLDRSTLSARWRTADFGRTECRTHGSAWYRRGVSAGLVVPSAVLPEAYDFGDVNVVLDPRHPEFARVSVADPIALDIDTRLQSIVSALPSTAATPSRRPAKTRR